MSRIAQALQKLKGFTWVKIPYLPAVERYLETGDQAWLQKVTPFGQQGSFWGGVLAESIRVPSEWDEEDRRVVRVLLAAGFDEALWTWLDRQLLQEKQHEDFVAVVSQELEDRSKLLDAAVSYLSNYQVRGRPTSAGRIVLAGSAEAIAAILDTPAPRYFRPLVPLATLLAQHAPELLAGVADALLKPSRYGAPIDVAKLLLRHDGPRFEPAVERAFEQETHTWPKFLIGQVLYDHAPAKFSAPALAAARAALQGPSGSNNHGPVATWMLDHFGRDVLADIEKYFQSGQDRKQHWGEQIVSDAVRVLGKDGMPVVLLALNQKDRVRRRALDHLIRLDDTRDHTALIGSKLEQGLSAKEADEVVAYIALASKWDAAAMQEQLWKLFEHKSKVVRGAAARALAKAGEPAVRRAGDLLHHKKSDTRAAAVMLLSAAATPVALTMLEEWLDDEPSEDVRDQILLGLSAAWEVQGRKLTRMDVEARIAKSGAKLKEPIAAWARSDKLPPLRWIGGDPLTKQAITYLIYRQSRAREIRPDIEAAPMYELIDRATAGEFARAILKGFLASKQAADDKWALTLVGLLGDDRVVPDLVAQIREWVEKNRGKLAEWAVQALALLGTDSALLAVDAMAIRYRNKMKNVGKAAAEAFVAAAEKQGVTPEELGDRVVPWLGFDPGKPRIIEAGKSRIEATIGMDLKLAFKDLEKGKPVKTLPKTAPKEVLAEFKDLSANLREIAKAQVLRLENLLVRQRRWSAKHWKELFLQHPLLFPFAVRLVWGQFDDHGKCLATFRALPDRTLTTNEDEAIDLPNSGRVGMIHPLELSEDERTAWRNHLADYEIEPPFPQLERDVVHCMPEQAKLRVCTDVTGKSLNAMTFKGRAEKLGWYRGSVVDGGAIISYYKSFPAAGCDVFLGIEDFYMGIDMYSDMKLGYVYFTRHGTVRVGSYSYDEPGNADDPRVIALGDAPAIVFSEVMGDLKKIAGTKAGEGEADADGGA